MYGTESLGVRLFLSAVFSDFFSAAGELGELSAATPLRFSE